MAKASPKSNSPIIDNTILELKIPWDKVAPVYQKTVLKLAQRIKLDGFRKGKAPLAIAKAQLDQEYLAQEVLNQLVPPLYVELIKKSQKIPLCDPEFQPIDLLENHDWVIKVIIAEKPALSVSGYQKIVKQIKQNTAKTLKSNKKSSTDQKQKDEEKQLISQAIFKGLVEKFNPSVPELLVKQETRHELQHLVDHLQKTGISLDEYLKKTNQTFDNLSTRTAVYVLGRVQLGFIFDAVATEAKITVSKEDLKKPLEQVPQPRRNDNQVLASLRSAILEQKVIDHLLSL